MNVQYLIDQLISKHLTIAVAESCTGGMISKTITDLSGVSNCFLGGCVTYSNQSKSSLLNVHEETLILHGAVSIETAAEMAEGVRDVFNADIGISTTGIAGPDGGTELKPVGTVCFGLAYQDEIVVWKELFSGNREQVRKQAVECAINGLLKAVTSVR